MLNYKQDINELNFDKKLINFIYNLFQKFILIISQSILSFIEISVISIKATFILQILSTYIYKNGLAKKVTENIKPSM